MSDDIFTDIWQKLASIYDRMNAALGYGSGEGTRAENLTAQVKSLTETIGSLTSSLRAGAGEWIKKLAAFAATSLTSRRIRESGVSVVSAAAGGVSSSGGVSGNGNAESIVGRLGKISLVPLRRLAVVVSAVVGALSILAKGAHSLAKSQLEQLREFTKYNAALARSFALSDIADFFRNAKYAEGTSETTNSLNEAFTSLKNAILPIQIVVTNLTNRVLTILTNLATVITRSLSDIVVAVQDGPKGIAQYILDGLTVGNLNRDKAIKDAVADAVKDKAAQKRAEQSGLTLPAERMFRNILNKDWSAVRDTRPALF